MWMPHENEGSDRPKQKDVGKPEDIQFLSGNENNGIKIKLSILIFFSIIWERVCICIFFFIIKITCYNNARSVKLNYYSMKNPCMLDFFIDDVITIDFYLPICYNLVSYICFFTSPVYSQIGISYEMRVILY